MNADAAALMRVARAAERRQEALGRETPRSRGWWAAMVLDADCVGLTYADGRRLRIVDSYEYRASDVTNSVVGTIDPSEEC